MPHATIIVNDASRGASVAAGTVVDQACARADLDARVIHVSHHSVLRAAEEAAGESEVLVAAGGDGTVSTVAGVAVRTARTFGVVPMGTLNHFARDAGIPRAVDEAIRIIAAGRTTMIDVGDVNGTTFLNNASLGMYPRLVWERQFEEHVHGHGRWTAFAIAAARSWRGYRTIAVRMTVDGLSLERETPFVFIGNGEYRIEGFEFGKRPSVDAGRLSVFVTPGSSRVDLLMLPLRALARRLPSDGSFEAFASCDVTIEIDKPEVSLALDGEIMLAPPPLRFTVRRRALRLLAPPRR